MLMKLVHHDITETNHAGIDHRANAVFSAPDKHSIKCYKKGTKKKSEKTKVNIVFVGCSSHVSPQVFIVSTLG